MIDAFLDIETTGLSPDGSKITVIGIHRASENGEEFIQLVGEQVNAENLSKALEGVSTIHTYNGSRFDLPFIHAHLGVDLTKDFSHCDLMYDCWQNKLYGGLKRVEQTLGIPRKLKDVNGLEAVRLWWRYENDYDEEALKTLCEYNREDVVNLKILKEKVGGKTYQRKPHLSPEERTSRIESYGGAFKLVEDKLRSIPTEALDFCPVKGEWSIREIVVHLADAEANAYIRCRRLVAELGSRVMAYDQDRWARKLDYNNQNIEIALQLFKLMRSATYALLVTLPDHIWTNTVDHSENGIITLEDWLETYEKHPKIHIEQIDNNIEQWRNRQAKA
jgi:uncharacterized protein